MWRGDTVCFREGSLLVTTDGKLLSEGNVSYDRADEFLLCPVSELETYLEQMIERKGNRRMITEKRIGELIKGKGTVYYVDRYTDMVYAACPTGILYHSGAVYIHVKGITVPGTHSILLNSLYEHREDCEQEKAQADANWREQMSDSIQSVEDLVCFCFRYMTGEAAEDYEAREIAREKAELFGITL